MRKVRMQVGGNGKREVRSLERWRPGAQYGILQADKRVRSGHILEMCGCPYPHRLSQKVQ